MLTKIIALSCLLASALATPLQPAEADVPGADIPTTPIGGENVITASGCRIEFETIETQACVLRAAEQCDVDEIIHEKIKIGKKCIEVTSRHCSAVRFVKREAEPQSYINPLATTYLNSGLGYSLGGLATPTTYSLPTAVTYDHHEPTCHDVTTEHCVDHPEVVESPEPVTKCHLVQKADCTPVEKKVPKTICEPKEVDLRAPPIPGAVPAIVHPFAYTAYRGYF